MSAFDYFDEIYCINIDEENWSMGNAQRIEKLGILSKLKI